MADDPLEDDLPEEDFQESVRLHHSGFIATDLDVVLPVDWELGVYTEAGDPYAMHLGAGCTPIRPKLEPQLLPGTATMTVGGLLLPPTNLLTGLLYGFSRHPSMRAREYYFWRVADIIWNNDELPEKMFVRNPWSERIIWECLNNRYLSIGGAASSSKSHTLAGWGIISWMARPKHTLVLMTSTTLTAARKRIWGSAMDLLGVVEGLPLKVRDSLGDAPYVNEKGKLVSRAGLSLLAAERSRSREAIQKFIGIKQVFIIVIADELSELSPAILTALTNLSKNQNMQMIGASNPNDPFDSFGEWSTPENGWESVDLLTADEWRTTWGGKYIRFDGLRNPNVMAGRKVYPFFPTADQLEDDKRLGEKSRNYLRMVRAVFFISDGDDGIYSPAEIATANGMKPCQWDGKPELIAGIDPAFTNGGDRTTIYFAKLGYDVRGHYIFEFGDYLEVNEDVTNKAVPRTQQIVRKLKDILTQRGIKPDNVGVDATGAGAPFCDLLAGEWDPGFLRVAFGGKASDKRVSVNSSQTGTELFLNRVTELWFVGKEFLRTDQIRGISPELAKEMCGRKYEMARGGGSTRIKIEAKSEYRSRHGVSPDLADAAFLALDLARQRFGFVALEPPPQDEKGKGGLRRRMSYRKLGEVYQSPGLIEE